MRFAYEEPAVIVRTGGKNYVVVGDLHIGAEKRVLKKGIRVYGSNMLMAERVARLAKEHNAKTVIILGDVKESVLYPDSWERKEIVNFFDKISDLNIMVARGNHDPHLEEIVKVKILDEIVIGEFAFVHGHIWPSENALRARWIMAGHNHMAVRITDSNKGTYFEKAWLFSKPNLKKALKKYPNMNKKVELVVLPAFNDLIMGTPANESINDNLSPLFRSGVFDYKNGVLFSLMGDILGTPKSLAKLRTII